MWEKFDDSLMLAAISTYADSDRLDTGYINRLTGEIVFIYEDDADALNEAGTDAAIDSYLARKEVAAAPDIWIEIPKYDPWVEGRGNEEEFIARFLKGLHPNALEPANANHEGP
jgi:hypothetical protein